MSNNRRSRGNPYTHRQPDLFKRGKDSSAHVAIDRLTDAQLERLSLGAFTVLELADLYERLLEKASAVWAALVKDREKRANSLAGRKAEKRDHKADGERVWPDREVLPSDFTEEEVLRLPEEYSNELAANAQSFLSEWVEKLEEWALAQEQETIGENYGELVHNWVESDGPGFWVDNDDAVAWIAETLLGAGSWDQLPDEVKNILLDPNNWSGSLTTEGAPVYASLGHGIETTGYLAQDYFAEEFPVQALLVERGYKDSSGIAEGVRRAIRNTRSPHNWSYEWAVEDPDATVFAVFDHHQALEQIRELGQIVPVQHDADSSLHVLDFDDGWYVVELMTDVAMRSEGSRMHHCVGTEKHGHPRARREGRARYFSLRDPEGTSILTFELDTEHRAFVEVYGEYDRSPGFGRGARNSEEIKPKYRTEVEHAIEFMQSMGFDPWERMLPRSMVPALNALASIVERRQLG